MIILSIRQFIDVEKFMHYNTIKEDLFKNSYKMKSIQEENVDEDNSYITQQIEEEVIDFNNNYCNKHSEFYKLDHSKSYVEEHKTYIIPTIYEEGGVFSLEKNECIHPDDPSFLNNLDCNKAYECNSGFLINGDHILNDDKDMCIYDCI